jgi:uncharacterized membrane protein
MIQSPEFYVPQSTAQAMSPRRSLSMWASVAMATMLLASLPVIAPLALAHGYQFTAGVIYEAFRPLCHQISERSFYLDGHPFAVCARCFGLYAGFAAGVMLYPLILSLRRSETPERVWLFLAAVPIGIDFALGFFGIWHNTHLSRLLTGGLFGAVAAFYIVPGLLELSRANWRSFWSRPSITMNERRVVLAQAGAAQQQQDAPSDYSSPSSRI